MPTFTHSHSKKRPRGDEDDHINEIHLDFAHGYYPQDTPAPRKVIPYSSPRTKKIRISTTPSNDQQQRPSPHLHARSSPAVAKLQSPPKTTITTTINLSPCHICHRRPTKKRDLDSYADCEGCGERTCFVCIRECLGTRPTTTRSARHHESHADLMTDDGDDDEDDGVVRYYRADDKHAEDHENEENRTPISAERSFSMEDAPPTDEGRRGVEQDMTKRGGGTWGRGEGRGHRGRICSQCCVELGTQGEVRCLGCLET